MKISIDIKHYNIIKLIITVYIRSGYLYWNFLEIKHVRITDEIYYQIIKAKIERYNLNERINILIQERA